MTAPLFANRDAAVDFLTTHRHGEDRKACTYCATYYGDILDKLYTVGLLRDPATLDELHVVGETAWVLCDGDPTLYGATCESVRKVFRALATVLTEDPS